MNEYIINVGLCVGAAYADDTSATTIHENLVRDALRQYLDGAYCWMEQYVNDSVTVSEPTFIGRFFTPLDYSTVCKRLHDVAAWCYQEAIAVAPCNDAGAVQIEYGALVGYHKEAWGAFNPDYFIVI